MTYFQIIKKQQKLLLQKLISLSSIAICLYWFSSCMQAEKISLDTSGANGLLAGVLGIEGGFFGAGNAAPPATDVVVNANGFIYNAGANSHPIRLNFSINQGANTDTCDISTSSLHTCSGLFELGDNYNVTIDNHTYTGGQHCGITNGSSGTINGSQPTIEVKCTRNALAYLNYSGNKLALLSINRTNNDPMTLIGSIINNVADKSPSMNWNGSHYLITYGTTSGLQVSRRFIDGSVDQSFLLTNSSILSSAISYDAVSERYLVVWIQSNYDIVGKFVDKNGTQQGGPITFISNSISKQDLAIAKTSTHFLVAYRDRDTGSGASSIQIKSIPLAGGTVNTSYHYDCHPTNTEDKICHHPSLASNSTGVLLSWSTSYADGEFTSNIYQTQLSNAGGSSQVSLLTQQTTTPCGPEDVADQSAKPFLAYNGSTYLLTWEYNCGDNGGYYSWVKAIRTNGSAAIGSLINITPNGSDDYYGGPTNWNGKQFEVFYIQRAPTENVILSLRAADGSEFQKLQKSVSSLGIGSLDDIYRVGLQ